MRPVVLIGAAGLLAYGAWLLAEQGEGGEGDGLELDDIGETIVNKAVSALGLWRAPAEYAGLIQQAEDINSIPPTMLERLLYQECRYRQDIITGRLRSSAGALGIAQFMPATAAELGIDPLNPAQAIPAAARYLRSLYLRFGTWREALAAYNWGMGNVERKGLAAAPRETRNYFTAILADVSAATGAEFD